MDNTIYISLPFFDIDTIGVDTEESNIDNHYIGDFKHIKIFTVPFEYKEINNKPKVNCKGVNVPYKGTWQRLTEAFSIGKIVKIKGCFYEITTITLEVTGKEVLEGKWLDTDNYNAVINVKPYGVETEASNEIVISLGVMG
jgi:hypothetical protein